MLFNPSVFKAYDIRGESAKGVSPELAYRVGQSMAQYLPPGQVAVGKDMRLDSIDLADNIVRGLTEQGRDVLDIGQVSTDMLYYAIESKGLAGGAMVTASHDPRGYNGIKLTSKGGAPIGMGSGLEIIRSMAKDMVFSPAVDIGSVEKIDITDLWVDFAIKAAGSIDRPLKVAWDAGNGMGGIVVESLLKKTNLNIVGLYLTPDGNFPHHHPNPMIEANLVDLKSKVSSGGFDCGVAFDGDADRAMLVDETGRTISASELGLVFAYQALSQKKSSIVYNASCSRALPEIIGRLGGIAIEAKVGRPSMKQAMAKHHAVLGIEQAQHYYFAEFNNDTSGLIACLRALSILSKSSKKLSELVRPYRRYYALAEQTFEVPDAQNAIDLVRQNITADRLDYIDGLSIYNKSWWANIRSSNTEPLLRINLEALDRATAEASLQKIKEIIDKIA